MGIYYWPLKNFVYRLTQKIFWNIVVLVNIEFEQKGVFPFLGLSTWLAGSCFLSSVQFSRSVMSDSLQPHELQHARLPCPSPTPRVHSNSHPLSQWCHPAISSSVVPFSSCPQFLPASEPFPMSQLFAWGGQNTGVSASASFPPKKSQGWSPSDLLRWCNFRRPEMLSLTMRNNKTHNYTNT